jgi:hypothetical protein
MVQSPNSDEGLSDSQMISLASYTLEMVTTAAAIKQSRRRLIFHCHFYPHLPPACGRCGARMMSLRAARNSKVESRHRTRALPDGEIKAGTAAGLVPPPTFHGALPSAVFIDKGRSFMNWATPDTTGRMAVNPGFPFFIPEGGLAPTHRSTCT